MRKPVERPRGAYVGCVGTGSPHAADAISSTSKIRNVRIGTTESTSPMHNKQRIAFRESVANNAAMSTNVARQGN
ncbi:MAG: hypothetical protein DMF84_13990 [Acidobacteria bacterium]|nr:MAG: hypothetical protein DMF84_13990 [Acidobacteriota bacterium]